MKDLRNRMAESITKKGDKLTTLESFRGGEVVLWYIVDHESYNNPLGRAPQYQVWHGNKRVYVGANRAEAYMQYEDICNDLATMLDMHYLEEKA